MNLNELLNDQLSPDVLRAISQKAGIEDPQRGVAAAQSVIHALLSGLTRNAQRDRGADSLFGALSRDHDGGVLSDIMSVAGQVLSGGQMASSGRGILGHILGFQQGGITKSISKMLGLKDSNITNLMIMLAPVVMGLLGKMRSKNSFDRQSMPQVLRQSTQHQRSQNQGFGILGGLIDKDGDGNIGDDLLQMGMRYLLKR